MDWSGQGYECNNQYGEEEEDEYDEDAEEEEDEDDEDHGEDDDQEDDENDEDVEEEVEDSKLSKPVISKNRRKLQLLCERMAALDQDSEMLVYRINQVNKLIKTGLQERKFLMKELDKRGDGFRTLPVTLPFQAETEAKKKDSNSSNNGGVGPSSDKKTLKRPRDRDKDPMLPKRPQNPFFQFCKEQRGAVAGEAFQRSGSHLSKKELTKLLACKWNLLNAEQKQVYNTRFVEERDDYNLQMEAYRRRKCTDAT